MVLVEFFFCIFEVIGNLGIGYVLVNVEVGIRGWCFCIKFKDFFIAYVFIFYLFMFLFSIYLC